MRKVTADMKLLDRGRIVRVKPGDVVVLEHPERLAVEQMVRIKAAVKSELGAACSVVVLDAGMRMRVARKAI